MKTMAADRLLQYVIGDSFEPDECLLKKSSGREGWVKLLEINDDNFKILKNGIEINLDKNEFEQNYFLVEIPSCSRFPRNVKIIEGDKKAARHSFWESINPNALLPKFLMYEWLNYSKHKHVLVDEYGKEYSLTEDEFEASLKKVYQLADGEFSWEGFEKLKQFSSKDKT